MLALYIGERGSGVSRNVRSHAAAPTSILAFTVKPVGRLRTTVIVMENSASAQPPRAIDLLIRGAMIVTLDAGRRILKDGSLAVDGDRIVAVGPREELEGRFEPRRMVDGRGFVVTPGFVNGHIHVTGEPLTRGFVPDDSGFSENVFEWLIPNCFAHTADDERLSAQVSSLDMLRNGTTTFLEAGTLLHLDAAVEGLESMGIRGRVGQWTQDRAFGPDDDQTALIDKAIRGLADQVSRYPVATGKRIAAWPCLIGHSINTDEVWKAAKLIADASGTGITAHMSPAIVDAEWFLANTGRRPIEHLEHLGVLGSNLSLTHVVHIDDNEVRALADSGTNVTHCPLSALKGAYGATSVGKFPELADAGVNIMLGTDGNNNGNSTDLMRCIYLAAAIHKDARRDPKRFPAHQVLEMATVNAARALQMSDQIGSLEPGKKADFVLHDTNRPEWRPLFNVVNQLVWSADGRGVHSVWVDGVRVVQNYRSTMIDEDELLARAQVAGEAIIARSGLPLRSVWPVS
ncbi:amidohydrolase [soil metagenome]